MEKEWLTRKTSFEEISADRESFRDQMSKRGLDVSCFDKPDEEVLYLKSKIQDGDELWRFRSDDESWNQLSGRAGTCIVRNGEIVASWVSMLS